MGKRIKRKIQILLRCVRQVVRGVACHAMFTTYDYSIGLKEIYLTFLNNIYEQKKINIQIKKRVQNKTKQIVSKNIELFHKWNWLM